MLTTGTFKVVMVSENKATGVEEADQVNKVAQYNGVAVKIKM